MPGRHEDTRGYDKKALGKRLADLRRQKSLKPEQLAEKARIKPEALRDYEQGKRQPYGKTLERLADALVCY